MIKAACTRQGQRIAIVGLSTDDLRRLRAGGGFRIQLSEFGIEGELVIMWGANERAIVDELAREGIQSAELTHS